MDWINAHRKAIIAAIGAVAILIVDVNTTQEIVGVADAVLILLIPNNQDAIDRIYHRA